MRGKPQQNDYGVYLGLHNIAQGKNVNGTQKPGWQYIKILYSDGWWVVRLARMCRSLATRETSKVAATARLDIKAQAGVKRDEHHTGQVRDGSTEVQIGI